MNSIIEIGSAATEFIFWGASFLTSTHAPGLVSLIIIVWLIVTILTAWLSARKRLLALRWLIGEIRSAEDAIDFAKGADGITQNAKNLASRKGFSELMAAWMGFSKTFIKYTAPEGDVLCSSARPYEFFNVDDLRFGGGGMRFMPGLFVSVGLFLTFLGLIAALQQMIFVAGPTPSGANAALDGLFGAVASKFVMSLTGLLASIIFTLVLRSLQHQVESSFHVLCGELERCLCYVNLEAIAIEQLNNSRAQTDALIAMGATFAIDQRRQERMELSHLLHEAVSASLTPVIDKLDQVSPDAVARAFDGFLSKMNAGSTILAEQLQLLSSAGNTMESACDRLDETSNTIATAMEVSVAKLAESADALSASIAIVTKTTEGLHTTAEGVARALTATVETTNILSTTTKDVAANAVQVMGAAKTALSAEQAAINATLTSLKAVLDKLESQDEKFNNIDEKLGAALTEFATHIRTSLDIISEHVRKMDGELAPALDTMREIVERAEVFISERTN